MLEYDDLALTFRSSDIRVTLPDGCRPTLIEKPRIIGLNKVDALTPDAASTVASELEAESGMAVRTLSGVTGQGVSETLRALRGVILAERTPELANEPGSWRP